jgi:hypothetical protein
MDRDDTYNSHDTLGSRKGKEYLDQLNKELLLKHN